MRFAAILIALCVASCASVAPEDADPHGLGIEIGRYGVMLHQTAELTDGADPPVVEGTDINQQRELARDLREQVWTYNLQRSRVCAAGVVTSASCGPAFAPAWLTESPAAAPSFVELARRSRAVGGVIMPFWNAVCADAAQKVADEQERMYVCAIE